jgi:hypothetical protein
VDPNIPGRDTELIFSFSSKVMMPSLSLLPLGGLGDPWIGTNPNDTKLSGSAFDDLNNHRQVACDLAGIKHPSVA